MPATESRFNPTKLYWRNSHAQTIIPTLFRPLPNPRYIREKLETSDGDFIDLDWSKVGSEQLVIVTHGLEGSSMSQYALGITEYFNNHNYDVLAWNFRGCGGEPNRKLASYHSGKSEDLRAVVDAVVAENLYESISLLGISVGGNITLKYLGEQGLDLPTALSSALCASVPCDLGACADELAKRSNWIYMKRFLRRFHEKFKRKSELFPGEISVEGYSEIKTFHQLDDRYTAPINGYRDARHYWDENSSMHFLGEISLPTLILNSADDPFLGPTCYPKKAAAENKHILLEVPKYGGHVGFIERSLKDPTWIEQRALEFF